MLAAPLFEAALLPIAASLQHRENAPCNFNKTPIAYRRRISAVCRGRITSSMS
jgi:hypothetical protein